MANTWDMARFVVPSMPEDRPLDALSELFRLSQHVRLRVPQAFVDLDIWSINGPTAQFFRRSFVHPVIQFSDKILYHQDKNLVEYAVLNYALNAYLRQLMVVGNRPVVLPIRATGEDIASYTQMLAAHLETSIGLQDARIRLAAAPRRQS